MAINSSFISEMRCRRSPYSDPAQPDNVNSRSKYVSSVYATVACLAGEEEGGVCLLACGYGAERWYWLIIKNAYLQEVDAAISFFLYIHLSQFSTPSDAITNMENILLTYRAIK